MSTNGKPALNWKLSTYFYSTHSLPHQYLAPFHHHDYELLFHLTVGARSARLLNRGSWVRFPFVISISSCVNSPNWSLRSIFNNRYSRLGLKRPVDQASKTQKKYVGLNFRSERILFQTELASIQTCVYCISSGGVPGQCRIIRRKFGFMISYREPLLVQFQGRLIYYLTLLSYPV